MPGRMGEQGVVKWRMVRHHPGGATTCGPTEVQLSVSESASALLRGDYVIGSYAGGLRKYIEYTRQSRQRNRQHRAAGIGNAGFSDCASVVRSGAICPGNCCYHSYFIFDIF